ncbi:MAG: hypothetical protein WC007_12225 [Pelobacteraceae bacterium]
MKCRVMVLSLVVSIYAVAAFADDDIYVRTGIGTGTNYGTGYGINNEFVANDYISGQLGVGYLPGVGWGAVGGLSLYPVKNNQYYVSPRVSALYGRMSSVNLSNYNGSGQTKKSEMKGFALGGGAEYPLVSANKNVRLGVDIYYVILQTPSGYTRSDKEIDIRASVGIAYAFK